MRDRGNRQAETNRALEEMMDEEADEEETIATIDMKRRTIEDENIREG